MKVILSIVRPKCLQTSLKWEALRSHIDTKCRSAEMNNNLGEKGLYLWTFVITPKIVK